MRASANTSCGNDTRPWTEIFRYWDVILARTGTPFRREADSGLNSRPLTYREIKQREAEAGEML